MDPLTAVDQAIAQYGLQQGGWPLAMLARGLIDKSGNFICFDDLTNGLDLVTANSPLTAASLAFLLKGQNETLYLTPAGTIATLTVGFPLSDAPQSRIGQHLTIVSTQIVTALTLTTTGLTIKGTAVTALAVNVPVSFKKVAPLTWMRML